MEVKRPLRVIQLTTALGVKNKIFLGGKNRTWKDGEQEICLTKSCDKHLGIDAASSEEFKGLAV